MALSWLMRALFVVFASAFAVQTYDTVKGDVAWDFSIASIYASIAAVVAAGMVFFESRFQRKLVREIVAITFGLAAGIVVTCFVVALILAFVLPSETDIAAAFRRVQTALPLITTAICYVSVTIVLQTKGDFRFLVPYIDFSQRGQQEGGLFLDTSSLVDGRIVDVCSAQVVATPVIIPDFVIRELQKIADSSDRLRRTRGRRGLDMVGKLQRMDGLRVQVMDTLVPDKCDVDLEIVALAKASNGRVVTTDFNLNKVATIDGVRVVNLNDLSNALKPAVIPGEELSVKLVRPGEGATQGVGYLEDGTMVVVEDGRAVIGQAVTIAVTGSHQTSAGRMIFGRVKPA